MTYQENMKKWLDSPVVDEQTKREILSLEGNEKELEYRFVKMLDFGTAGLRGILGAGLNMMNIYTVRYTTQGLADVINASGAADRGVAIAYDSRHMSKEFAWEAAKVLAANGIKSFLFDELRPTPELSYSLRYHNAIAGINITASHNPKQYNGYKVYWEDGAQIGPDQATDISAVIASTDIFDGVKVASDEEAKPYITIVEKWGEVDETYMQNVLAQALSRDEVEKATDSFSIVYTPFHGSGHLLVPEVLKRLGFKNIITVAEQMVIDGEFPTVKSPNPEDKAGFAIAIEMAKQRGIDLIIGTDPDADRVGIIIRDSSGEYIPMTGNQVGALLLDYIIKKRRETGNLPANACAVKSIVSTELATAIAKANGVTMMSVLTGFKFIGEKIKEFEVTHEHEFIFGFEESYGYLAGTYARDKDAVVGSMLIAEMACYYKNRGMSLYEAMQGVYAEYGRYEENVISVSLPGLDGVARIGAIMGALRDNTPKEIGGFEVECIRDYKSGKILDIKTGAESGTGLPSSNVLFYELEGGCSVVVRPSGTEPKIKFYITVKGTDTAECAAMREKITAALNAIIG